MLKKTDAVGSLIFVLSILGCASDTHFEGQSKTRRSDRDGSQSVPPGPAPRPSPGPGSGPSPISKEVPSTPAPPASPAPSEPALEPKILIEDDATEYFVIPADKEEGNLTETPKQEIPTPATNKVQTYVFGEDAYPYDYILVIDNSSSMATITDKVKNGFKSILTTPNVFPPLARIAVMSTMTGASDNLSLTGLGISKYLGIEYEPGFLDFINKASIVQYKAKVTPFATRWPLEGCDQKWFEPTAKDSQGEYCLTSTLQTTGYGVGAEAGIRAFKQLIQKNINTTLFRPQAIVNVIFVSDTHDPGTDFLDTNVPSYPEINALVGQSNKIKSLRFNAIAPDAPCPNSVEKVYTKSYFAITDASMGQKADVCTLADYSGFLQKLILASKTLEPKFPLDSPASKINKVTVDDIEILTYTLSPTKDSIIIDGLDPKKVSRIKVDYWAL